jgi:hypothetical protein
LIQQSPTGVTIAAAHGLGGASMGILVQRRVHGKIHTLGRVPFGPQRTGRVKIHWDLAVEGKPLKQGSYLITLRALDDNGDVVAINKPVRLKIRHH